VYEDGKMDIRTEGQKVFRILEMVRNVPGKLYGGAIVNYPQNQENIETKLAAKIIASVRNLHKLLNITKDFNKPDEELTSYDLAHHAGLSIREEYELLGLLQENQRLEYLRRHLAKLISAVTERDQLFEPTPLSGQFFSKN
jgi:Lon protease-like protein